MGTKSSSEVSNCITDRHQRNGGGRHEPRRRPGSWKGWKRSQSSPSDYREKGKEHTEPKPLLAAHEGWERGTQNKP